MDPARSLSIARLAWPRQLRPSSVFMCDCPAQPTFSPRTQWVNEDDPCWWCKCHVTRGRKDRTITLGAFRSREENHTNKCSLTSEKKKLKIVIILLLCLDQPEQTDFACDYNRCDQQNLVDWWAKPEDGHFNL